MKSLRVLRKKLGLLAGLALFDININSVVGRLVDTPEDALVVIAEPWNSAFRAPRSPARRSGRLRLYGTGTKSTNGSRG